MTQIVPLVIYRRGQRVVIGSAEIDGEQMSGEIFNKELIDLFRIKKPLAEFSLVAEPAIEKVDAILPEEKRTNG